MTRLRSFLFSVWFYAVCVVMVLSGQVLSLFSPGLLRPWARYWSHLLLLGLPIVGIRYVITGRENLPKEGPMLIASMHQSAFDTLLWFSLLPYCRYVVKIELTRIPLFGRLAKLSGQIGVDRSGGATTMRMLLRKGGAALAEGTQVVIFPEGTRVPPGERAPLQPGIAALAKAGKLPVIPVATDSGLLWRRGIFNHRPGVIHVAIMKPIEAGLPREELMRRIQEAWDAGVATFAPPGEPVDNSVH
jgi:1-acyl-sn-glycerol-3-phosphate acyltransferase